MIILGRQGAAKNLADVIDDDVASGAESTNDSKFGGWFLMVCSRNMLCKPVVNETKRFAQEMNSLANDVALGKDILDMEREGGVALGRRRRVGKVVRVMRRTRVTRDDLRERGKAILRQVGVDATLSGQTKI